MVVLEATAVAAEPLSPKVRGRIRTAVMTLCRRLPRLSATRTQRAAYATLQCRSRASNSHGSPHRVLNSARLPVPPDRQYRPRDLNSHPFGLDSESSASTNSTRPAQCQWRESNSHPFGAASQTAAAAVTPHWQGRKRRDSNAQDAVSNVRRVSGPAQSAISATLPKAEPERVELSKPCGLPRFERGGLANVPKGSNGR